GLSGQHRFRRTAGLVLPTASFEFDSSKLAVLLKMIARGLAWYHWKSRVPPDYYADVLFMPDMVTVDFQDVRSWNAERRFRMTLAMALPGMRARKWAILMNSRYGGLRYSAA